MVETIALAAKIALEVLLGLVIGRYVLRPISLGRETPISALFWRTTDPWFRLVRRLTPSSIGDRHIPILGILLILNLWILVSPLVPTSPKQEV